MIPAHRLSSGVRPPAGAPVRAGSAGAPLRAGQPAFGWRRQEPPEGWQVVLGRKDIDADGLPTAALVEALSRRLVGDDNRTPRFFVITGTLVLFNNRPAVLRFQQALMTTLAERLHPVGSPHPENGRPITGHTIKATANANRQFVDGFNTHRSLHWDVHSIALASIAYGPFHNVSGGYPQVCDVRHAVRDNPGWPKVAQKVAFDKSHAHQVNPGRDGQILARLLADYTLTLDQLDMQGDMPILFFNNHVQNGLAHGATDPVPTGPGASRELMYCMFLPRTARQTD